ncbi:MAG: NAD(P)H-dependent oxidoreductase [Endomicrobium sp.]|jgi:flavodoxin|nr:NAD(P)H-dependent oxidoreductase [Endomicrobium sp.]
MKKLAVVLAFAICAFAWTSVYSQTSNKTGGDAKMDKKILVAYYSHSGNTKALAEIIQKQLDADIFEIQPSKPYPSSYHEVTEQGKKEVNSGYKPALKEKVKNISQYDTIIIGSPVWWGTIAPAVNTFISENDLSGKRVAVFVTHGGGGASRSLADVKKALPKSDVLNIGSFQGKSATEKDASLWLEEIKIK